MVISWRKFTLSAGASRLLVLFLIVATLISACATTPNFNLGNVDQTIQPRDVVQDLDKFMAKNVLWGGVIINSANVKEGAELEILVYPLDTHLKPKLESSTLGRIIALHKGYLETRDYAPGRLLTLVGTIKNITKRPIDKAEYTYPVVEIVQSHLWPEKGKKVDTQVHFGIGVMVH